MSFAAAALRVEVHIPDALSLKAKRSALRPVIEGLRRMASLSVAEVNHHDAWQRATIGIAIAAPDSRQLQRMVDDVRRYLGQCIEIEVLEIGLSHLEDPV